MEPDAVFLSCDVCRRSFQFGPNRYDGKVIPTYAITVCMVCWDANWDGWAPHLEEKVTVNLRSQGKPLPPRNAKDWLPRE
jgi:hypothetical protein